MSAHGEFQQWLVIDWLGTGGTAWVRSGEKAERFLLVTPNERKWEPDASSLSLPRSEFVLVMLLADDNQLNGGSFNADNLLGSAEEPLPIWCHYGGSIILRELEDEWGRISLLDEALRDKLTKRLPPPNPYPMAFSDQLDLAWQSDWKEIKNIINSYESKEWYRLVANLNVAWEKATSELGVDAVRVMLAKWLGARNAFELLLWRLPENAQETTKEQLATIVLEARALQLPLLRQAIGGARSGAESSLSTAFENALTAIAKLMLQTKNGKLAKLRDQVGLVRRALNEFGEAYDQKVKLANRR